MRKDESPREDVILWICRLFLNKKSPVHQQKINNYSFFIQTATFFFFSNCYFFFPLEAGVGLGRAAEGLEKAHAQSHLTSWPPRCHLRTPQFTPRPPSKCWLSFELWALSQEKGYSSSRLLSSTAQDHNIGECGSRLSTCILKDKVKDMKEIGEFSDHLGTV